MTKQNRTKWQFVFGGALLLTIAVAGCNNNGENKEATKDTPVTFAPPTIVRDSIDTMESKKGEVSPGTDLKPQ